MSVRKMRLVSDALYNKLFSNVEGDPVTHMVNDKTGVLSDETIPNEMKPLLYHQAVRNVNQKLKEEIAKPLPVAHEAFNSGLITDSEKDKRALLERWLDANDIKQTKPASYRINNRTYKGRLSVMKDWLVGERNGKKPGDIDLFYDLMTDAGLPKSFFEYPQSGSGFKRNINVRKVKSSCGCGAKKGNARTAKSTPCGMKKKIYKKGIQWKKY